MMRRACGFTLIEVLVALAIVTVGMAAVLGAMTSAADTAFYLRDKTFAQWVALNRIAEVRLNARAPEKGKTEGDADFAGRKWHWEQEVLPMQLQGLLRIDVQVRPAEIPESDKGSWYSRESGILGDAVDYNANDESDWDATKGFDGPAGSAQP